MNPFTQFIDWLFEPGHLADSPREEEYLAQSVDIYDLERRMRQLERRVGFGTTEPALTW